MVGKGNETIKYVKINKLGLTQRTYIQYQKYTCFIRTHGKFIRIDCVVDL